MDKPWINSPYSCLELYIPYFPPWGTLICLFLCGDGSCPVQGGNDQLYGNAGDDLMVDHRTTQVMVDYSIRALMSRLKVTVKLDKTWT
jgi:hypothetical protein